MTAETPSTDQVRHVYTSAPDEYGMGLSSREVREYGEAFDRWLREHDAKVLRDAADAWAADPDSWGDNEKDYRNELRDRADRIANGERS